MYIFIQKLLFDLLILCLSDKCSFQIDTFTYS